MTNDERQMTKEFQMLKNLTKPPLAFGHSNLVIISSFGVRHSSLAGPLAM